MVVALANSHSDFPGYKARFPTTMAMPMHVVPQVVLANVQSCVSALVSALVVLEETPAVQVARHKQVQLVETLAMLVETLAVQVAMVKGLAAGAATDMFLAAWLFDLHQEAAQLFDDSFWGYQHVGATAWQGDALCCLSAQCLSKSCQAQALCDCELASSTWWAC